MAGESPPVPISPGAATLGLERERERENVRDERERTCFKKPDLIGNYLLQNRNLTCTKKGKKIM